MKYALIIPDGCADEPQESLGNQTPLQAAQIPQMDAVATCGLLGEGDTIPPTLAPGSDVGMMSLFGYDPLRYHTGRAPLEAAAQGLQLSPDDWAIRCNMVTVIGGVMKSFTAGQIPNHQAAELIALLQHDQCGTPHWEFHAGVSYRNLLIYRSHGRPAPFSAETRTTPPHDILDRPIEAFLPRGPGGEVLRDLMRRSEELFADYRATLPQSPTERMQATGIWLWGLGKSPALPSFEERFGVRGGVITAVDLLRGMGRLLGWQIVTVPGATGYLDTDYAAKGAAAVQTLRSGCDFVVVHVEATDEASHEGNAAAKVQALEQIDAHIVQPVHEHLRSQGAYRLLISPDHPTLLRTRTHSHGRVPFALCGAGIAADESLRYDEPTAARSGLLLPGHELMPRLLFPR